MGLKIWILGILFVDLWVCYFDLGFGVRLNGCLQIWCMWFGFKFWWVTFQICGGHVVGCCTIVFLFYLFIIIIFLLIWVRGGGSHGLLLHWVKGGGSRGWLPHSCFFFFFLLHWVRGGGSHGL